jgi:hypothetical protein
MIGGNLLFGSFCSTGFGQSSSWSGKSIVELADDITLRRLIIQDGANFIRLPMPGGFEVQDVTGEVRLVEKPPGTAQIIMAPSPFALTPADDWKKLGEMSKGFLPSGAESISLQEATLFQVSSTGWWSKSALFNFTIGGSVRELTVVYFHRKSGGPFIARLSNSIDVPDRGLLGGVLMSMIDRWAESKVRPSPISGVAN